MGYKQIKRFLDLIVSLCGLVILSPLLILVAIFIKIESEGPIIFKQKRLGKDGKVFLIYKFRSMSNDAEKNGVYSTEGDPRVTKVGKFIRKTSIDELPQFFNIIKGDMSLIGPRPTLTYHPWFLDEYTSLQKKRFEVRPGVTGWAQVNGRKEVPWDKRIEYDVEYVNNLTLAFDLRIFAKTVVKVATMEKNYNLNETNMTKDAMESDREVAVTEIERTYNK